MDNCFKYQQRPIRHRRLLQQGRQQQQQQQRTTNKEYCTFCYCIVVVVIVLLVITTTTTRRSSRNIWTLLSSLGTNNDTTTRTNTNTNERILYIITSISEYDTGRRATTIGYDRYTNTVLPVIVETVQSLLQQYSYVDVYLITHYTISQQRYYQLRIQLPSIVGLQIWDSATPYNYINDTNNEQDVYIPINNLNNNSINNNNNTVTKQKDQRYHQQQKLSLQYHTRGLARQHRFIIKDKLQYYTMFICMEDDMVVHYPHITQYQQMTNTIYQLRQYYSHNRIDHSSSSSQSTKVGTTNTFYGPMTVQQLGRMIPGFIRVEVIVQSPNTTTNTNADLSTTLSIFDQYRNIHPLYEQIPIDYTWEEDDTTSTISSIDPSICCHRQNLIQQPMIEQLYFWEMSIEALGVRKMPSILYDNTNNYNIDLGQRNNNSNTILDLDWVMLLGGNNQEIFIQYNATNYIIHDYWSGNDGYFDTNNNNSNNKKKRRNKKYNNNNNNNNNNRNSNGNGRPDLKMGQYNNNQGGWIATKRQIIEWHTQWCRGSFLPPYDTPYYNFDGLDGRTVEYWSGGIQLVGANGCNLQRIVSLHPNDFGKHLLYHTSNNKQKTRNVQYHFSGRNVNEFWGQMNTVRKNAIRAMNKDIHLILTNNTTKR